jgi:hypothetical protein
LDQHLFKELLLVEVANFVERKQAQVQKLAELLVLVQPEDVEKSVKALVNELHEEAYALRVLEQVN